MNRLDTVGSDSHINPGRLNKGSVAFLTMSIFVPVMALAIVLTLYINSVSGRADMKDYFSHSNNMVDKQAAAINRDIHHVSKDLIILANQKEVKNLWGLDGEVDRNIQSRIEEDYLNISLHKGLYDQIRLLDKNGMEIVRVNYNNGQPAIVAADKLQNKKGRYYFDDAFALDRGEIFVSPFDLNIEHGKIEFPLKPMIRFATPVYDHKGVKQGIVLLNYLGAQILDNLSSLADDVHNHQTMLLNRDGYWLKGPKSHSEWGFMYEDRKEQTFGKVFPETWEKIIANNYSQFISDEGLYTSKVVYPLLEDQRSSTGSGQARGKSGEKLLASDYYWIVVHHVPQGALYVSRNERNSIATLFLTLFGMVFFIGSLIISIFIVYRRQAEFTRKVMIEELQAAMRQIKTLDGLLPICSHCKKIRDDKGYWNQLEAYITKHSHAEISHGICQECAKKYYPDYDLYGDDKSER